MKNEQANITKEGLNMLMEKYIKLRGDYEKLREENQTLKDNVEFLHSCLDDRDKSIAIMQEEKKTPLEKQFELVEVNGYKAPRYQWKKTDEIIRYSRMCLKNWFPYLFKDED